MSVSRCSCAPRELSVKVNFRQTYSATNALVKNGGIADSLCKLEKAVTVTETKLSAQVSGEERTVCGTFPTYKRCNERKMLADVGDEENSGGNIHRQLDDDNFQKITDIQASAFDARLEFIGTKSYAVQLWDRDSFDVRITDVTDPCNQDTFGSLLSITGVTKSGAEIVQRSLIEYEQDCGVDKRLDISEKDNEACGTEFVSNMHSESSCSVPLIHIPQQQCLLQLTLLSSLYHHHFSTAFTTSGTGNSNSSTKFQEFESSESFKSTKGFQHRLQQACKQPRVVQLHLCRSYCRYHVSSRCYIARCCSKEHEEVVSATS